MGRGVQPPGDVAFVSWCSLVRCCISDSVAADSGQQPVQAALVTAFKGGKRGAWVIDLVLGSDSRSAGMSASIELGICRIVGYLDLPLPNKSE